MTQMTFQSYIQKMQDAQNDGVPVNWQSVATNLAATAQQQIQMLQKELADLRVPIDLGDLGRPLDEDTMAVR
jgi:hypothetical protein